MQKGHAFGEDTVWQKEFEDAFPYTETDDQLRSVEEIKADMESPSAMDRLLCGDVGFGKNRGGRQSPFQMYRRRKAGGSAGAYHDSGQSALLYSEGAI